MADEEAPAGEPHYASIGCLLAIAGVFAGGMLGVAFGWVVTKLRGCVPPQGFPICDIYDYWLPGMFIGALSLPGIVLWRLRRGAAETRNSTRSSTGGTR
ncbi:MAG: hypothetical protein M3373_09335 [Gemmatimonadota bacterium]|nr:hypothetical protein [Gemmatimonadota bacterium]